MRVKNMTSPNGNFVANQFIIIDNNATYFQSYNSIIAKIEMIEGTKKIFLDEYYYNYSRTTSKYRNLFLGEVTKDIEKKIKEKEYTLTNLN
tara:strand:+ start:1059 stop:1331 length:273 start_codon:yes stop_codon:yes gene_type:complete